MDCSNSGNHGRFGNNNNNEVKTMNIKKELPFIITILVLACGFVWLGYVYYKSIPQPTWTINKVQMVTESSTPGGEIIWMLDICRYTDKEYVMVNYLRNSGSGDAVFVARNDDLNIKKGECKHLLQKGNLPLNTALGDSVVFVRLTVRDTPSELHPPVEAVSNTLIIKE